MKKGNAIILCGGGINYANLPIATNTTNAMIPVHGKPIIGWIIDDLIQKGFKHAIVALQLKNKRLLDFLKWAYQDRITIEFAFVAENCTIVDSLHTGLTLVTKGPVHLLLGDTLIRDDFQDAGNMVYVSEVPDHRKWCMIKVNRQQYVTEFFDKPPAQIDESKALVGYYRFADLSLLRKSVDESRLEKNKELSSVLKLYGSVSPIEATNVDRWFDFGNLENFVASKMQMFQSRHFNSIEIDGLLGVLIKRSKWNDKLKNELDWFRALPEKLRILCPRFFEHDEVSGEVEIVQEYYGYPNLAELFLYSDLNIDIWISVIDKLLATHLLFKDYEATLDQGTLEFMYITKTEDRLGQLQDEFWQDLLQRQRLVVNGKEVRNFFTLLPSLKARVKNMQINQVGCIIHGDFCFSNILFDVNNLLVKVIDPRGSFGAPGIYGDPRYDMAKLRHSVEGLYDFITADLFSFQLSESGFNFKILTTDFQPELLNYFDLKIQSIGYLLDEIKLIEALLFISMVPLHADHPNRQKVMYLKGVELLNEVLV